MGFPGRLLTGFIIFIVIVCFSVAFAGAQGKAQEDKDLLGLVDVKECEGVKVTQCELAKNLILSLKMGEDLTCEACFIQLRALGIAPVEDWSYADPHKVVSAEEIREVVVEIHRAYTDGTVRSDGFEVAAGINGFCREIKGPTATPAPSEKEKKETEMVPAPPAQEPKAQGPAPAEGTEKKEDAPPSGAEEGSGTQKGEGK
ncbi:MAG: hypothetical protein MUO24_06095 [Desulfobacterales bacterium]|nr:hypothetical protein [Desulfobacterales bacterium]